jgi:hypothetical protein
VKVKVYQFKMFDIITGNEIISKKYGTETAIKQLGGNKFGEEMLVEKGLLDGNGLVALNEV